MMTRDEMIKLIVAKSSPLLFDELNYFLDIDREEEPDEPPYDLVTALFDATDATEAFGKRKFLIECRTMLIDIGFYRIMTIEEIENIVVSRGTPWAFKLRGIAYTTDFTQDPWMWQHEGWRDAT